MGKDIRLSFKEMCERFQVTPRTLRYYEYIELLSPERVGRARFYGPREIARMKLILRGRRFGFSLEEIRQWLELYDADPEGRLQMERWVELADRQLGELQSRVEQLQEAMTELRALRDQVAEELRTGTGRAARPDALPASDDSEQGDGAQGERPGR